MTLHKKSRFPLRISSVNVTKSATFAEKIHKTKPHFFCSVGLNRYLSQSLNKKDYKSDYLPHKLFELTE